MDPIASNKIAPAGMFAARALAELNLYQREDGLAAMSRVTLHLPERDTITLTRGEYHVVSQ